MVNESGLNNKTFRIEDSVQIFSHSFNRLLYYLPFVESLDSSSFPDKWEIKGRQGLIHAVPPLADKDAEEYFLESFKGVTYRYLLRDCIESFALGLDDLYAILQSYKRESGVKITKEEFKKLESFARAGIYRKKDGKFQRLKKDFGLEIPEDYRQVVSSLKDIRDCLSHSAGVVMHHHGIKTKNYEERKFTWLYLYVFAKGIKSGKAYDVTNKEKPPEQVNLSMETKKHERICKLNEFLIFTPAEAFEIANSLKLIFERYIEAAYSIHDGEQNI